MRRVLATLIRIPVMQTSPRKRCNTLPPRRYSGGRPKPYQPIHAAASSRPDALAASTVGGVKLAPMRTVLGWPENTVQNSRQIQKWHWRPRSFTTPSSPISCAPCVTCCHPAHSPMRRSRSHCATRVDSPPRPLMSPSAIAQRFVRRKCHDPRQVNLVCRAVPSRRDRSGPVCSRPQSSFVP